MELDKIIFDALYGLTGRFFILDGLFIIFAQYLIYILVLVFFFILLRKKDWKERIIFFAFAVLAIIISRGILTELIGFIMNTPRPFVVMDINPLIGLIDRPAFPSGHLAFIIPLSLVLWMYERRIAVWFFAVAFMMGISRVAVGVHWPSDIVGGILVGTLGFALAYMLLKKVLVLPDKKKASSEKEEDITVDTKK